MDVAEVMTAPVITVTADTSIAEAARIMLDHRISGLPVVDARGAVVGMITEGDLLRRSETGTQRRRDRWLQLLVAPGRLAEEYADANARKVGEAMTPEVVAIEPRAPLTEAVRLMERRRVKRLPVIDEGRLVGIVSRANLVRALLDRLAQPAGAATVGDAEIRARILTEIARQPWGPRASVDVRVKDGVAELHGSITDDRERNALHVLAENTPGVRSVTDHLVWVEPMSGIVIATGDTPPPGSA